MEGCFKQGSFTRIVHELGTIVPSIQRRVNHGFVKPRLMATEMDVLAAQKGPRVSVCNAEATRTKTKTAPAKGKRKRIYYANIDGRGGTKVPDLRLRTSNMDFKVLCETNCRPGSENSINLNS